MSNKVLFVDDEINILRSIERTVLNEEFQSFFEASGEKALEVIKNKQISVIVTDMRMPNMNALELLRIVKEISPSTVRIVLSGYTQLPQIIATINSAGIFKFIAKPWDNEEEFLPAIKEAIAYYNLKWDKEILAKELEFKNNMYKKLLDSNNTLVKNTALDISNLKRINNMILNLEKSYFSSIRSNKITLDKVEYYTGLINGFYHEFLDTIPTVVKSFNEEKLYNEILSKTASNIKILGIGSNEYTGNIKAITLILASIMKTLLKEYSEEEIFIINRSSDLINMAIIIKNPSFLEFFNSYETKLLIMLGNEFLKSINFVMTLKNGELLFTEKL